MSVETRRLHQSLGVFIITRVTSSSIRKRRSPPLGFLFSLLLFFFSFSSGPPSLALYLPISLPPSSSSLSPASQTPYTRQAGKRRLMQSDRHADGHRDTCGCGQVAGETQGQVGADTAGGGGSGQLRCCATNTLTSG